MFILCTRLTAGLQSGLNPALSIGDMGTFNYQKF